MSKKKKSIDNSKDITPSSLPEGKLPTKERYLEIALNLETAIPKTEFEKKLIQQMKEIVKMGGVIDVPYD